MEREVLRSHVCGPTLSAFLTGEGGKSTNDSADVRDAGLTRARFFGIRNLVIMRGGRRHLGSVVPISNYGTECIRYKIRLNHLPWKEEVIYEGYVLDQNRDLDLVKTETLAGTSAVIPEDVEVPSACQIRLKASLDW